MAASSTDGNRGGSPGIAILVSAAAAYDIIATINSSPQTAEINAKARAHTLMKWVNIGIIQALFFVILAAMADARNRAAILFSGTFACTIIYWQYLYALRMGLQSSQPGTEDYR
jgi:hypothetical protein